MTSSLNPDQIAQLQSFWNLIQTTDEGVQKELFVLLKRKYTEKFDEVDNDLPSFLQMQGILKSGNNQVDDCQMLEDYLTEKYGV
jgi:hypothetical protein